MICSFSSFSDNSVSSQCLGNDHGASHVSGCGGQHLTDTRPIRCFCAGTLASTELPCFYLLPLGRRPHHRHVHLTSFHLFWLWFSRLMLGRRGAASCHVSWWNATIPEQVSFVCFSFSRYLAHIFNFFDLTKIKKSRQIHNPLFHRAIVEQFQITRMKQSHSTGDGHPADIFKSLFLFFFFFFCWLNVCPCFFCCANLFVLCYFCTCFMSACVWCLFVDSCGPIGYQPRPVFNQS